MLKVNVHNKKILEVGLTTRGICGTFKRRSNLGGVFGESSGTIYEQECSLLLLPNYVTSCRGSIFGGLPSGMLKLASMSLSIGIQFEFMKVQLFHTRTPFRAETRRGREALADCPRRGGAFLIGSCVCTYVYIKIRKNTIGPKMKIFPLCLCVCVCVCVRNSKIKYFCVYKSEHNSRNTNDQRGK